MNHLKSVIYLSLILIFSVYICIAPPNEIEHGSGYAKSDGGKSIPNGKISYIVNISTSDQFRNRTIEINFILKNEKNSKIPDIIIFGKFEDDFEVVDVSHHNQATFNQENFKIICSLDPYETKTLTYYLRIKKTAHNNSTISVITKTGLSDSYDKDYTIKSVHAGINVGYKEKNVRLDINKDKSMVNDGIFLRNNMPKIISSNVTIVSELHLLPINDSLLYKYTDEPKPIQMWLNVSGSDEEDENLTYTWIINPVGNLPPTNNKSYFHYMYPLKSSETYSFGLYVEDKDLNKSEEVITKISYKNISYNNLIITNARVDQNIIISFIFIIFLFLLIAPIFKYNPDDDDDNDNPWMYRLMEWVLGENTKRYALLLFPILVYAILIYIGIQDYFRNIEYKFYITSLALLEVVVFLEIFIFITLFTHHCFSKQETKNDKITVRLWIVNLIGMITILVLIIFVIPLIDQNVEIEEHLQWYYSTMAQVFASILAIVAVFYTALPNKNIVSINIKKGEIEYNHPKILHLFIIIYGLILVLVLLGLSSGVHIEFPTFIAFDLGSLTNIKNLTNIFSLILFATTLLMIPPAISSLYALIRITAFTGTVKIMSEPCASRIYLEGYDTRLITPVKLMLRDGQYDLSFKITKNPRYVFRWDEIPGNDDERLKQVLEHKFGVDWIKTAKVEKIDIGKTIIVHTDKHLLSLKLNKGETVVVLEIEDGRTYKFIAKMDNGKLNIYYTKHVKLFIKSGTEKEYHVDVFKLEQDNSDNQNICDYLVSSKYFK